MEAAREDFADSDLDHTYSLISAIFNASFGTGQALAPIVGTSLYSLIGYRFEFITAAVGVLLFALLYMACVNGCGAYRQMVTNFKMRNVVATVENRLSIKSYKTDV